MLKKVIRPDGRPVEFRYDALGRRTAKQYFGKVTRWIWDGNVPIHEWRYKTTEIQPDEKGESFQKEPIENITTWVFEEGTFVPTAKIQEGKQYSIVSDYLGTPSKCTTNKETRHGTVHWISMEKCLPLIREQNLIVLSAIKGSMWIKKLNYATTALGTTNRKLVII